MKIYVLDFTKENNPVVSIVHKRERLIKGIYNFKKNIFFVIYSNLKTREQFRLVYNFLNERDWSDKIVFICKKFKQ